MLGASRAVKVSRTPHPAYVSMAPFHGPGGANAARSIPTGSLANAERWFEEPDQGAESSLESGADRNCLSATKATANQCQAAFCVGSTSVRLRSKACPMAPFCGPCGANAARSIPTGSLANAERWFEEPDQGTESTLGSGADRNRLSATKATAEQCQTAFCGGRPLSGFAQKRAAGTLLWPGWDQRCAFNSHWFTCERGAVVRRTRPGCGEHPGKWSRPEPSECNKSHRVCVPDRLLRGSTSVRLRSKACRWHPFVARVGPTLRVQFPPRELSECNERWWRRWELNPRPKRLGVMRYVCLPGTPRRVSPCLSRAVIQVINTTMKSPDLPLIAGEP
jgi:hypothetical protein